MHTQHAKDVERHREGSSILASPGACPSLFSTTIPDQFPNYQHSCYQPCRCLVVFSRLLSSSFCVIVDRSPVSFVRRPFFVAGSVPQLPKIQPPVLPELRKFSQTDCGANQLAPSLSGVRCGSDALFVVCVQVVRVFAVIHFLTIQRGHETRFLAELGEQLEMHTYPPTLVRFGTRQ